MKSLVSQALDRTMFEFKISGAGLSRDSGVSQSQLSQFRTGKVDISTSNFVKIVCALPENARRYYLRLVFNVGLEVIPDHQLHDEATEAPVRSPASPIISFVQRWLERNQITVLEFELAMQQRTNLSLKALRDIMSGRIPTDTEIGYLGMVLRDQNNKPYDFAYLLSIRDRQARHDSGKLQKRGNSNKKNSREDDNYSTKIN